MNWKRVLYWCNAMSIVYGVKPGVDLSKKEMDARIHLSRESKARVSTMNVGRFLIVTLTVCAISSVWGDETVVYEFRPAGMTWLGVESQDAHVLDKIDIGKAGRFVSLVGYLAGIGEKGFKRASESFYAEALELAYKGSDDMEGALALWKDNLEASRKMKKVKDAAWKIGLAITITDGIIKIRNAKTEDEQVTETCRLALHLFSTALGTLTKPQIGNLISELGDHGLDHPEDNGFAILVNWIYDHSSLPEMLSEWWWDVRYKGKILMDKDSKDAEEDSSGNEKSGSDDIDPFDESPENGDGKPGDGCRYQGLKPLKLID